MNDHPKSLRRVLSRTALRLAAGTVLLLGLGAPSPGYTGGCGGGGGGVADPVQFCVTKEAAVCARECETGRYSVDMCNSMCLTNDQILMRCAGNNWPPGCAPTQAVTNACIQTLMLREFIDIPSGSIVECMATTLCRSGSALTSSELSSAPEGI